MCQENESFVDCCDQFNPIACRPYVHFLVQNLRLSLDVLLKKSYSFSLHTILKEIKPNNTLCCLTIECIFLFIEIRYLITTQSILTLIVSNNSKSICESTLKATVRSLKSVRCIIFCLFLCLPDIIQNHF